MIEQIKSAVAERKKAYNEHLKNIEPFVAEMMNELDPLRSLGIHIFSGIKPGHYTLSYNERHVLVGADVKSRMCNGSHYMSVEDWRRAVVNAVVSLLQPME